MPRGEADEHHHDGGAWISSQPLPPMFETSRSHQLGGGWLAKTQPPAIVVMFVGLAASMFVAFIVPRGFKQARVVLAAHRRILRRGVSRCLPCTCPRSSRAPAHTRAGFCYNIAARRRRRLDHLPAGWPRRGFPAPPCSGPAPSPPPPRSRPASCPGCERRLSSVASPEAAQAILEIL